MKKTILLLLCGMLFMGAGCSASGQPGGKRQISGEADAGTEQTAAEGTSAAEEAVPGSAVLTRPADAAQMPDIELTLLGGETVSFSDYQGKKVLLNFWATWCGPCVGEMPAFQRLTEEYSEELVILAVNCGEDEKTVQKFVQDNGYAFPVILDEQGEIQSLFGGITSIPLTVVIDEEGYLLVSHMGAADAETMYETYKEELGL